MERLQGPEDAVKQYLVIYAEDTIYGITEFDTLMIEVSWTDAPLVVIDSAYTSDIDGRVDVGTSISVYFHCVWLENGSAVNSGLLYVNSTPHSINATGWIMLSDSRSIIIRLQWIVTGVEVDGVTDFEMSLAAPSIIWDAISVTVEAIDERINVGELAIINVTAKYVYDDSDYSGRLALNDTILRYFTVGRRGYTVVSASDDKDYGITVLQSNGEVSVIWDGLILDLSVTQHRVGLGISISVQVSAIYAFDGSIFDGTLPLNDSVFVQSFVGKRGYTVLEDFIAGGVHEIDEVVSNDETYV
ncbi:MAG: hypothetical protein ACW97A_14940, partial [Candidatus Thorarchaeota archaeon]